VTGSSGFLGQRLCKRLSEEGHAVFEVPSKVCDLTKEADVCSKLPRDGKFDMIYHLAAWTRAGDFSLTHPGEQWVKNQQMNTNVLSWWKDCQPQAKMVTIGTSCSYDPQFELKEENYMKGTPVDSLFTYAMTKRMLYAGLLSLNKQYGLKYVCFVPSALYGPTYHTDGRQMQFIFDLARKIVRGKKFNERVVLWGDGYQRREIVHIDDFVAAMIALSSRENEIVNIGTGAESTIREFAGIICNKVGYDQNKIEYDTSRYVGAKSKCLDTGKMQQLLPGFKSTPMDVGIGQMVEWFVEREKA